MYRRGRARLLDEAAGFSGKTRRRPPGLTSVAAGAYRQWCSRWRADQQRCSFHLPGSESCGRWMRSCGRGWCAPAMARLPPEPSFWCS